MILREITIKNFRSFGNNTNKLTFSDKGELILVIGKNGSGKSSIINSIDFSLYKKCRSHKGNMKLKNLPNRINKNLVVETSFYSHTHDNIDVVRGLEPNIFKLKVNGQVEADDSSTEHKQYILDKYLDYDYDAWKSYISLSVNDFKDFLSLPKDDKKTLLNKLFNLEMLNVVSTMLKKQLSVINNERSVVDSAIKTNNKNIEILKQKLETIIDIDKTEIVSQIEQLKEPFKNLKDSILVANDLVSNNRKELKLLTSERAVAYHNYLSVVEKLETLKEKVCPICNSDLSSETIKSYTYELEQNKIITDETLTVLDKKISDKNDEINNIESELRKSDNKINTIKSKVSVLKSKMKNDNGVSSQLSDTISEIIDSNIPNLINYDKFTKDIEIINSAISILKEPSLRSKILSSIIDPMNVIISEILDDMNVGFTVKLDYNFNAVIYHKNEEVDDETLSNGEIKKVNTAVMLAYIIRIRYDKHVNILFLDEVFSSIDSENINEMLIFLYKFASENKINIFLVHHAILDYKYFDRVLKIEKDGTSNITVIK